MLRKRFKQPAFKPDHFSAIRGAYETDYKEGVMDRPARNHAMTLPADYLMGYADGKGDLATYESQAVIVPTNEHGAAGNE